MKYSWMTLVLFAGQLQAQLQRLQPAVQQGAVTFQVDNFGFTVTGELGGIAGIILYDPADPLQSRFDVTVQSATVNTGNQLRDKHLRGPDYFNTTAFPLIRLTSGSIKRSATGELIFLGTLSIKGTAKQVAFPFQVVPDAGGHRFTGRFTIKRRDFGVGGRSTVSNEVNIQLNVLARKL